ncbi:MAG TPA: hypothetical protein VHX12_00525, partial [Acidisoma sp.]|nr:hypothetical protein [Acidisoma sp.]
MRSAATQNGHLLAAVRVQTPGRSARPKNLCMTSFRYPLLSSAALALALTLLAPARLSAQDAGASALPSVAPPAPAGANADQRGRALLDQMVQALGGIAWLNRVNMQSEGRGTSFFHGEPNPYIVEFHEAIRYDRPTATPPAVFADRVGFLTDKSMIFPGKKIDVIQIMTAGHGYEVSYKGKDELPKDQVDDYYRRFAHSIEAVVQN